MREATLLCRVMTCTKVALLLPAAVRAQTTARGSWSGVATIPGRNLEFRIDIAGPDSAPTAIMDVPESKLIRFPVPSLKLAGDRIELAVPPTWGLAMFRDIGLAPEEQVIQFSGAIRPDSIS